MLVTDEIVIIPIGTGCLNQFEINHYVKDNLVNEGGLDRKYIHTGLLDWTLQSLESTLEVMNHYKDGSLFDIIANRENYIFKNNKIQNIALPNFYFWHESITDFPKFVSKMTKLIKNMDNAIESKCKKYTIWNNVQFLLYESFKLVESHKSEYYLSKDYYDAISKASRDIFDATAIFIVRKGMFDEELINSPNVYVRKPVLRRDNNANEQFQEILKSLPR